MYDHLSDMMKKSLGARILCIGKSRVLTRCHHAGLHCEAGDEDRRGICV